MIAFAEVATMGPHAPPFHVELVRRWLCAATSRAPATLFHDVEELEASGRIFVARSVALWLTRYHVPGGARTWQECADVLGYSSGTYFSSFGMRHWPRYPGPESAAEVLLCRFRAAQNGEALSVVGWSLVNQAFVELERMAAGKEANPWTGTKSRAVPA